MRRLVVLTLALASCGSCDDPASAGHAGAAQDATLCDAGRDAARDAGAADAQIEAGPDDDAMPASDSDELSARARHLLEAIAQDNPDLATDMLFPREAWTHARNGPEPERLWDRRVKSGFSSAIHAWAKRSTDVRRAQFVSFEIGKTVTRIEPKRKEWKRPCWRVLHSRLTYSVDGRSRHLEVAEMVGWRGAWYVVRLR